MRIIAGSARGRRITAPEGRGTRPMTDRARESTFNMLHSLGVLEGAVVLDLYAGSGSLGLEALSRGAARVTFVEADRRAVAALRHNVSHLGFERQADVRVGPVAAVLPTLGPADLVFCDPPYAQDPWPGLLAAVPAPLVVAHTEADLDAPPGWEVLRRRRYGRAAITILQRDGGDTARQHGGDTARQHGGDAAEGNHQQHPSPS
jgi:16S rRNA (guanine966-N2)-methyltransferase